MNDKKESRREVLSHIILAFVLAVSTVASLRFLLAGLFFSTPIGVALFSIIIIVWVIVIRAVCCFLARSDSAAGSSDTETIFKMACIFICRYSFLAVHAFAVQELVATASAVVVMRE